MAWAAVAAVGASVYAGEKADKANRRNRRTLGDLKNFQLANLNPALADQERLMKKAHGIEESGMEADALRFESRAVQGVADQTTQAQGAATAGLAGQGMLGSGLAGQVRAGVAAQTSRAMTDAQLAVSALRGAQRSRKAANLRELGAFQAYKANARNAILGDYGSKIANTTYSSQGVDASGFGQYAALASLYGSGGGGGGGGGDGGGGSWGFGEQAPSYPSDRRLKRDIVRVGRSARGFNVYEFDFIGHAGRYRGVMADEVPARMVRVVNGVSLVDYSQTDVAFERVS